MKGSTKNFVSIILALTMLVVFTVNAGDRTTASIDQPIFKDAKTKSVAEKRYLEALNSENEGVRLSAIGLVGRYNMTGAVDKLIEILKSGSCNNVRLAAALSLLMINDERGHKAIVEMANVNDGHTICDFCKTLAALSLHHQI
jgi:HEAT repeat protein